MRALYYLPESEGLCEDLRRQTGGGGCVVTYSIILSIFVDEYGVVAQIVAPLVEAKITTFYISSCHLGNTLVCVGYAVNGGQWVGAEICQYRHSVRRILTGFEYFD